MPRFDLSPADLTTYRPTVAEPADFDEFWTGTIGAARAAGGDVVVTPVATPLTLIDTYDVTFPGFAGDPVKAWLWVPRGTDGPLPAVVEFNGYGGGRGLPHERLSWANAGYAHLFMDTRGQGSGWGSGGETPDPHGSGPAASGFMTRGIDDPATYYYRRLFTDGVRAVDAVRGLPQIDPARVAVTGGSQGGGIAIAVGGLVEGLRAVMPDVPFLCHFERAVGLTDADPYQEIVRYLRVHRGAEERVFRTLSYVDGVNFAARISAPALFSAALHDMICPPSTVFAAYNRVPVDDKAIEVYPFNEHEGGQSYQWLVQAAFLRERL
ncbi:cephalosporin-C deacetylase [Microbacterium sp. SLBN-154]|uniref:acetylxylan esterase n=1 Tax=Microbacterium sp. SLBN-154 TaxID=2768458 RepID=UPI001153A3EA|nr:acetylxylan esterase [Microbacterium sp. SLBN-154]TQK18900.1 cephalosporin-C deacetylase [Microbacterium sp. SLBN-154]